MNSVFSKYVTAHAPAPRRLGRVHGLHLALGRREPAQSATSEEHFAVPGGPEADVRRAQARKVEGMRAAGGGLGVRAREVDGEEGDDARVIKAAIGNMRGNGAGCGRGYIHARCVPL